MPSSALTLTQAGLARGPSGKGGKGLVGRGANALTNCIVLTGVVIVIVPGLEPMLPCISPKNANNLSQLGWCHFRAEEASDIRES